MCSYLVINFANVPIGLVSVIPHPCMNPAMAHRTGGASVRLASALVHGAVVIPDIWKHICTS